jgi:hypothetical protein
MRRAVTIFAVVSLAAVGSIMTSSCGAAGTSPGATSAGSQGETSRLKLSNKFYKPIIVRLERLGDPGHRDIIVPARSSESIRLKPGTYRYRAAAKGFRPISKYKELEPNRGYTLYF